MPGGKKKVHKKAVLIDQGNSLWQSEIKIPPHNPAIMVPAVFKALLSILHIQRKFIQNA
jgi:hypothetical protein